MRRPHAMARRRSREQQSSLSTGTARGVRPCGLASDSASRRDEVCDLVGDGHAQSERASKAADAGRIDHAPRPPSTECPKSRTRTCRLDQHRSDADQLEMDGRPPSVTDRLQKGDCGVFTGPWGNHLGSHWPEASKQVPLLGGAANLAAESGIQYEPRPRAESSPALQPSCRASSSAKAGLTLHCDSASARLCSSIESDAELL